MMVLWAGLAAAAPMVEFVGDGAEVLTLDAQGLPLPSCTSPCEVSLAEAPQTFFPGIGGKPLVLDDSDDGRVFRVSAGAPKRRMIGMLTAAVGSSVMLIAMAADANPEIELGAAPYLGGAAIGLGGFAITIGSRPRFIEM